MPSIFDPAERAEILRRLERLEASATPRWGGLSVDEMVAHLADSARVTLGEIPSSSPRGPFRLPVVRRLAKAIPLPRGVTGPPEAFGSAPRGLEDDRRALRELVERLGARGERSDGPWPHHPVFGPMSGRDWGCFVYKHMDHHLRQFGV